MTDSDQEGRGKPGQTKDRVLQARIPRDLDEELRGQAQQLGLSVSTVVRNVLVNTFQLVEGVVADSTHLADVIQGRRTRPSNHPPANNPANIPPVAAPSDTPVPVAAWQEAVLNLNGICDQCNNILHKGERAAIGIPAQVRPVLLCLDCLAGLSAAPASPPSPATSSKESI